VPDTLPLRPAAAVGPAPAGAVEALSDRREAQRPASLAAVGETLLLTARQAAQLCGVSVATWHRMAASGRCPAPLRLSPGCVRWPRETLVEWIRQGAPLRREFEARQAAANGRPRRP
jgi:predicted DNA-binding transcriptional regulator AlpA